MKLRSRFLAALLALFGLLTVSVNGAWAAPCGASTGMESVAPAANAMPGAHPCAAEMAASRAVGAALPGGSGSGVPHCPSMPMSATGACGAALALPAIASPQIAPSLPEVRLTPRMDAVHELLLAAAFFRPPIA